jgi:hypothetical protein
MNVRSLVLGLAATLALAPLALAAKVQEPCVSNLAEEGPCETSCCPDACCGNACVPCWQGFAEYLLLRPRNAGLEYAVPTNGPIQSGAVSLQEGRTASLNPQFDSGFRVGFGTAFDQCSTISASYTYFNSGVSDAIEINRPLVIQSLVSHPSSFSADTGWNSASAHQDIKFQFVDLDYRHVFLCDERSSLDYLVGLRYASLNQSFGSQFNSIVTENVTTDVNFDGGGFRLGIEGERYAPCRNIFLYGKASASFLGGEFRGNYFQGQPGIVDVIAETNWKEARFVSILDCEIGIGWSGCCGHVKASAGYTMMGWLNVVKTGEFISAVQANKYHGPDKINGNGLEFDGFVAHLEVQW